MYHQILFLYYRLILMAYFNDMHYLSSGKKKKMATLHYETLTSPNPINFFIKFIPNSFITKFEISKLKSVFLFF